MIPKIDRDSGLFNESISDKINKKVSLVDSSISALYVPKIESKETVVSLSISPTTLKTWDTIGENTSYATFNTQILSNNSFVLGQSGNTLKILSFTLKISAVFNKPASSNSEGVDVDEETKGYSETNDNGEKIVDGNMLAGFKVPFSPLCDVWFAAKNGTFFIHIPAGSTTGWVAGLPTEAEIDIYTWFI